MEISNSKLCRLIWFDPLIYNFENTEIFNLLDSTKKYSIIRLETTDKVVEFLTKTSLTWIVISCGRLGEVLTQLIQNMSSVLGVIIFCGNKKNQAWTKNYLKIKHVIDSGSLELGQKSLELFEELNQITDQKISNEPDNILKISKIIEKIPINK